MTEGKVEKTTWVISRDRVPKVSSRVYCAVAWRSKIASRAEGLMTRVMEARSMTATGASARKRSRISSMVESLRPASVELGG